MSPDSRIKLLEGLFPNVSREFTRSWHLSLHEYSSLIWTGVSSVELDSTLIVALQDTLIEQGLAGDIFSKLKEQLSKLPVIQTAHHVTPTNGPIFSTIDLISLVAKPDSVIYVVGANSGVPFSNAAWSGSLVYECLDEEQILKSDSQTFKNHRKSQKDREQDGKQEKMLNLIPSKNREQLVYGSKFQDLKTGLWNDFSPKILSLFPNFSEYEFYVPWALQSCANIQRTLFNTEKIVYLDINRWIQHYIIQALSSANSHPVYELLFNENLQEIMRKEHASVKINLFATREIKSKKNKVGMLDSCLVVKNYNANSLLEALRENQLTPTPFLIFYILSGLNGMRCLGSFLQYEYFQTFIGIWSELNKSLQIPQKLGSTMLTTGKVVLSGYSFYALDFVLNDMHVNPKDFTNMSMGEIWSNMIERMLVKK